MKHTVLIASKDLFFLQEATEIQQRDALDIELIKSTDHLDIIKQLTGETSFDYLLMTLALPNIANGYTLLSRTADKLLPSKNIFVFVKNVTEQIIHSLRANNIDQIHPITGLQNVLHDISTATTESNVSLSQQTHRDSSPTDLTTIRNALNQTMGPAGSFIFESCGGTGSIDPEILIEKIVKEIGMEREIKQFYTLLKTL